MATNSQSESREQDQQQSTRQSLNDFQLIPYAQVDGEWTLPENFVRAAYQQIKSEGRADTVFWEGTVPSEDVLVDVMQRKSNVAVFLLRDKELLGIAWLNGFQGSNAFGHFCFMREASKSQSTVAMGRAIVDYWLSFPTVDFVLGIVPSFNNRAMRFVQKIGFIKVGAIPNMMEGPNGRAAAVIFYNTRIEDDNNGEPV